MYNKITLSEFFLPFFLNSKKNTKGNNVEKMPLYSKIFKIVVIFYVTNNKKKEN